MDNKEVAHLWANQSRNHAKGSHFYFEDDTIYSYGSHFPIARHFKGAILFTTLGHSATTERHKSYTRQACHHLKRFHVKYPKNEPSGKDLKDYAQRILEESESIAARRDPSKWMQPLENLVKEANDFAGYFGFSTRFAMYANFDALKDKVAKAKAIASRKEKARLAQIERDAQEKIAQWQAGENVQVPYTVQTVYLRALPIVETGGEGGQKHEMQSSRGARVPMVDAENGFRFAIARRGKGWHRNGETFAVGDYQLDAINEQGIVAGCHRIGWPEIERFAKAQGWI